MRRRLTHLGAVAQKVIGQDAGHHRLTDRDGADADAGIVTAFGRNLVVLSVARDGPARGQDRGSFMNISKSIII